MLRGRGGCYKHSFYGIESHRCMETTPSLACANKCVFCWRHHTNPGQSLQSPWPLPPYHPHLASHPPCLSSWPPRLTSPQPCTTPTLHHLHPEAPPCIISTLHPHLVPPPCAPPCDPTLATPPFKLALHPRLTPSPLASAATQPTFPPLLTLHHPQPEAPPCTGLCSVCLLGMVGRQGGSLGGVCAGGGGRGVHDCLGFAMQSYLVSISDSLGGDGSGGCSLGGAVASCTCCCWLLHVFWCSACVVTVQSSIEQGASQS